MMAPLPKTRRVIKAENRERVTAMVIEDESDTIHVVNDRGDNVSMPLSQWQGLISNYLSEVKE